MKPYKLSNGMEIPPIGLGTWQINGQESLRHVVSKAAECGYRLFDTAAAYSNEIALGKAIRELGIEREQLYITDKLWNTSRGFQEAQEACKKSLKKLKLDYLDVYLIHWPATAKLFSGWQDINAQTWRGMEALYKEGYVRSIGVCNFKIHHLEALEESAEIQPMINQFEFHPGMYQRDLLEYCRKTHILAEASSPLGNGKILQNPQLMQIASAKGKTAAQVSLRWAADKGICVIPKTENADRLKENMDIFDFSLTGQEQKIIDEIPYCGGIGIDADEVTEFG